VKIRLPLYARVLLWFALNLAVLATGAAIFFGAQLHLGLDALLKGSGGDRIDAVRRSIASELEASPRSGWTAILGRFGEVYHVRFLLLGSAGGRIAGEEIRLPPPVDQHLRRVCPPPPPLLPQGDAPRSRQPDTGRKGMISTENPRRYWVILQMPLRQPDLPQPMPAALVVVSDTLGAGGLFFDPLPWVAAGLGVLLVSALCWWPFIRGITSAIARMTAATGRIAEGHFEIRVPAGRGDELGQLARSINGMAERLEGFVAGQKRFLGDIAHELCSPLARMQMALGILERDASGAHRAPTDDLREELQQMSDLVNELLSFSKASLGKPGARLRSVKILDVAEKAVRREAAEAEITLRIPPGLHALAKPDLLQRCLANLIRNAIRYAGHAGPITVSAKREGGDVSISVADRGPGIPADEITKIFDPFYRIDDSRTRDTGGVGLGLAIVKTCAEACGGSVSCRNRIPSGLKVTLKLRAAEPGDSGA